jgi:hypothetical protein
MLLLTWNSKWENVGNAKVNRSADTTLIAAAQTYLYNCSQHLSHFLILFEPIEICCKLRIYMGPLGSLDQAGSDRVIRFLQIGCLPLLDTLSKSVLAKHLDFHRDHQPLPHLNVVLVPRHSLTGRTDETGRDKGASLNWLSDASLNISH